MSISKFWILILILRKTFQHSSRLDKSLVCINVKTRPFSCFLYVLELKITHAHLPFCVPALIELKTGFCFVFLLSCLTVQFLGFSCSVLWGTQGSLTHANVSRDSYTFINFGYNLQSQKQNVWHHITKSGMFKESLNIWGLFTSARHFLWETLNFSNPTSFVLLRPLGQLCV